MTPETPDRLLGWAEVRGLIGLSRTTAWRLRHAGDFPAPVHLSPGRVAWRARDIAAWNESRSVHPRPPAGPTSVHRPSPPQRRPSRVAAAASATISEPAPVAAPPTEITSPSPPVSRRRRPAVAEGQLGFDF